MKRVKVLIPFHSKATGKDQIPDDIIEVTDEQLAAIKAVNVNMVLMLGEVEDDSTKDDSTKKQPKPKAKKQKESK